MYNLSGLMRLREGGTDVKRLVATVAVAAALLVPTAANAGDAGAIVRVTGCPPGYTGYVVQAWNEKRGWYDVAAFCIPWGP